MNIQQSHILIEGRLIYEFVVDSLYASHIYFQEVETTIHLGGCV
jgi:hypothetical protein